MQLSTIMYPFIWQLSLVMFLKSQLQKQEKMMDIYIYVYTRNMYIPVPAIDFKFLNSNPGDCWRADSGTRQDTRSSQRLYGYCRALNQL